jgi:hypothetical protein
VTKPLIANCGNCNAYMKENPIQGVCRAKPPVPILLGIKQRAVLQGLPDSGAEPMITSYFPPMRKEGWCREWEPTEAMEGAFIGAAQQKVDAA